MRRLGIVTIVFLFGCSFNSGAAQEVSLARGRDLLKHGSYKEAIGVFTALIDKNARDAALIRYQQNSQSQGALNDYKCAEVVFRYMERVARGG